MPWLFVLNLLYCYGMVTTLLFTMHVTVQLHYFNCTMHVTVQLQHYFYCTMHVTVRSRYYFYYLLLHYPCYHYDITLNYAMHIIVSRFTFTALFVLWLWNYLLCMLRLRRYLLLYCTCYVVTFYCIVHAMVTAFITFYFNMLVTVTALKCIKTKSSELWLAILLV